MDITPITLTTDNHLHNREVIAVSAMVSRQTTIAAESPKWCMAMLFSDCPNEYVMPHNTKEA